MQATLPRLAAPALLLLALGACQAAHAPLPAGLAHAPRLPVEGRQGWTLNQHLRFGPFEAYDVDRSWTRGRDFRLAALGASRRVQEYAFAFREAGGGAWRVECFAALRTRSFDTRAGSFEPINGTTLDCELQPPGEDAEEWRLALDEEGERPQEGMLGSGAGALEVVGTRRLEGGLATRETTAYRFTQGGETVAAVEVIDDGAVWLHPELEGEDRDAVAAAAAALLLAEDLRRTLPER